MQLFGGLKKQKLLLSTCDSPFKTVQSQEVVWPLVTETGKSFSPIVEIGTVLESGAKLAHEGNHMLFAPLCGEVKSLETVNYPPKLRSVPAIKIEVSNDANGCIAVEPNPQPEKINPEALWRTLESLVVPSFEFQKPWKEFVASKGDSVKSIVVNIADQDLGITAQLRLAKDKIEMLENIASLLKHLSGNCEIAFAVPEAEKDHFQKSVKSTSIHPVKAAYPNSLHEMVRRNFAGSATELGTIAVIPFSMALYIYNLVVKGEYPRNIYLTVVDKDGKSQNVKVLAGTPVSLIVKQLALDIESGDRVIMGGSMNGTTLFNLNVPILPGVNGLTIIAGQNADEYKHRPCVNCGACIDVCPAKLQPQSMGRYCEYERYAEADGLHYCIECGLCSYVCPSFRPLKQWFHLAKEELVKVG